MTLSSRFSRDQKWVSTIRKDENWVESTEDAGVPPMGTMIIRTWRESGHLGGFRARIIYGQTPGIDQSTVTTADPNEVLKVVQHWLAAQSGASVRN
jgi:hypothetical protein